MKKILGLDLGVSSIGWALIEEGEDKNKIIGMGTRIIPLSTDDKNEFSQGNAISKNQKRTQKRTQRKGYDRYQQRREKLNEYLKTSNMLPDEELMKLNKKALWDLRSSSISKKLELKELGRVFYHLNQKRGYKSSRSEANMEKKDTEYVAGVKSRYEKLKEQNLTIGQYFFKELINNDFYRTKDQVFPREAYMAEFDSIIETQRKYYPELLTDDFVKKLRNEIIFYQRKLKSQKRLVAVCEFEGVVRETESENGQKKPLLTGPKVAPRSSPLFQVSKIWETINTIRIENKTKEEYSLTPENRINIFQYLQEHEKLTLPELFKILKLKKDQGWITNKFLEKGLQGDLTRFQISKCFDDPEKYKNLLEFNLEIQILEGSKNYICRQTGDIKEDIRVKVIDQNFEKIPYYRLWHIIYSITDEQECTNAIIKNFKLPFDIASKLSKLDFTKQGFGNKSAKAIRKILPYLIDGFVYSDACQLVGYNHSESLTIKENLERQLSERLTNLEKNSLRQPVVEKILNQMINLVNALIDKYGKPHEIKVELARELRQSREERNKTYKNINERERENKAIAERLENEYKIRATRNNILKWRLFHSINGDESKLNDKCIYCGSPFGISAALLGEEVDIEHIVPRSKLFDDSQNNKILAHRHCNKDKGERTAYDYMRTKSDIEFNDYLERINDLYKNRIINKTKRDRLLMTVDKIPKDFITRQLNETRYISRKSREILSSVCRYVSSTSGSVTDYLRRIWGWNDILMNLQLQKYRDAGLTQIEEVKSEGRKIKKEVIPGWTKRNDHRHHALDALVIASTKQSFIHRINNLSSESVREEIYKEIEAIEPRKRMKRSLLEAYIAKNQPFTPKEIGETASAILVSFKPGKKVVTYGVRKIRKAGKLNIVQQGITVPRGPLSEETVYGKIKTIEKNKPVKYLFEHPDLIFKPKIQKLVKERLDTHRGDVKKALISLKKDPVFLDEMKTIPLTYGTCFKEEYVVKYPIGQIKAKDIDSVIDPVIKNKLKERLEKSGGNEKTAFKNLDKDPIWYDDEKKIPVKTVRCHTGLDAVEPLKADKKGKVTSYVKPGNNHHIAIYIDKNGNPIEHICTFWHAVERKKFGIPVVIINSDKVWDKIFQDGRNLPDEFMKKLPEPENKLILSMQQNEMFLMGLPKERIHERAETSDYAQLSNFLYRVQKIARRDYFFRHHLETELIDTNDALEMKRFYRIRNIRSLLELNPVKVRINLTGKISILRND